MKIKAPSPEEEMIIKVKQTDKSRDKVREIIYQQYSAEQLRDIYTLFDMTLDDMIDYLIEISNT